MRAPFSFWLKRLVLQIFLWIVALEFISVAIGFLIYPASRWLTVDSWESQPTERWWFLVLTSVIVGGIAGALMTLHEWLQHGDGTPRKRAVVSLSVVIAALCFLVSGKQLIARISGDESGLLKFRLESSTAEAGTGH